MSRKTETTLLPELEEQLVAAARRLEVASPDQPRKRRSWLHGWPLVAVILAGVGASVAVARVAEVGPFAYMATWGIERSNPKLAPTSVITVRAEGDAPDWQARAYLNGIGQLCFTGGPADPRTNPDAAPSSQPINPPQNGLTCGGSEEVAQLLVDADRPGASFASASPLDGDLQGQSCRMDLATRRCIPVKSDPPTRLLVYGLRSADAPRPVVRWGAKGKPIAMRASSQQLRMPVDKSPLGLDPEERRTVAGFPDELRLVLWAAEVKIPAGADQPQVVFSDQFAPHGVDDATIELLGGSDLLELMQDARRNGWKYVQGIRRDPAPVRGTNTTQRRWIAAFARARAAEDRVPARKRSKAAARFRASYGASRKLEIVGGGLRDVWLVPGALPEDMQSRDFTDAICFAAPSILRDCKFGTQRWKQPLVEAIGCAKLRGGGEGTLVWALTPPGANRIELRDRAGRTEVLPPGELVAVRRPVTQRIEAITWFRGDGRGAVRVRVPWPTATPTRCDKDRPFGTITRKDNGGSHEES